MDKFEAQYSFWASFGVPAYEENSVPDVKEVTYPYITYETASGGFESEILVKANVWTRSTSWLAADTLSESILERLGGRDGGGVSLTYDGGAIWITPEDYFSYSMGDPDDDRIKRKVLSVVLRFI